MRGSCVVALGLWFSAQLIAQSPPPAPSISPAMALLNEVTQKYHDATSYRMVAVKEDSSKGEMHRDWSKVTMSAIAAPGRKFRFEGQSRWGFAAFISDGHSVWRYREADHLYTRAAVEPENSGEPQLIEMPQQVATEAEGLQKSFAHLADRLKSASLLPEERLVVAGLPHECLVVRFGPDDLLPTPPAGFTEQETLWIDKNTKVVWKSMRAGQRILKLPYSKATRSYYAETVLDFSVNELNIDIPDSAFAFEPPADAKLVEEFPGQEAFRKSQQQRPPKPDPLPVVQSTLGPGTEIKSADGKLVTLATFRGRPLLIDA